MIVQIKEKRRNAWYSDLIGQRFDVTEVFVRFASSPNDAPKRRYYLHADSDGLIHPCDCSVVA